MAFDASSVNCEAGTLWDFTEEAFSLQNHILVISVTATKVVGNFVKHHKARLVSRHPQVNKKIKLWNETRINDLRSFNFTES